MAILSYIEAVTKALKDEMQRDEKVFVIGEDVGVRGGVFRATDGLIDLFGEERVINSPLSEALIVGASVGAAAYGMRPVAEIQFADFIMPAVNQMVSEAAKMRYRSNNDWHCPLVVRAPYGGGVHGALYHSQCVESFFSGVAGLKIVMPATPYDVYGLLVSSIRDNDPVLFLEHKRCYRLIKGEVPDEPFTVPIGKAEVKREGTDVTVISYGLTLHFALKAAEKLETEGISVHVLDLRTIRRAGSESDCRRSAKDRQGAHRSRRQQNRRCRWGSVGDCSRRGIVRSRCPDCAFGWTGRSGHALQHSSGKRVHVKRAEGRAGDSRFGRILMKRR